MSKPRELVVISGKGGTGKTSIVAAFAALARNKVLADCDVDAADLHLVLEPEIRLRGDFSGGKAAWIDPELCMRCGRCRELCRFEAVKEGPVVDPIACEGCAVCSFGCPSEAIEMRDSLNGEWFVSETRHGPMVHARLGIAEENSGKLVTLVRNRARELAGERGLGLIIADGSPGIGCPVIASITGADLALIVTEPTMSGIHDLERAAGLAERFGIPVAVCVNKADINPAMAAEIQSFCDHKGVAMPARIDYDPEFTLAQIRGRSIVEHSESIAAEQVRNLWRSVSRMLNLEGSDPGSGPDQDKGEEI